MIPYTPPDEAMTALFRAEENFDRLVALLAKNTQEINSHLAELEKLHVLHEVFREEDDIEGLRDTERLQMKFGQWLVEDRLKRSTILQLYSDATINLRKIREFLQLEEMK